MKLEESPVFARMKAEGKGSKAPLTEAFARWANLKLVLIALFGAVAGQAVVWYAGQFYALFFLERTLRVDGATANILIAIALALATPFFILFGWLSDRIGRKKIILAGCALAALTYFPLFEALSKAANPALHAARRPRRSASSPTRRPARSSSIRSAATGSTRAPATSSNPSSPARASPTPMSPRRRGRPPGSRSAAPPSPRPSGGAEAIAAFQAEARAALTAAGYPERADPAAGEQAAGRPHPVRPRPLRDDGLRPDRGAAGRALPDPDPLQLDVAALPYRQWLVRRLPPHHRLRHGRRDRRHLLRPLVPDRRWRR